MSPTVILIRHAEAEHNATSNWDLPDPGLTDLGFQQSRQLGEALQKALPGRFDVQLVLVSPMRRTLQTAIEALGWLTQPRAENGTAETNLGSGIGSGAPVPIRAHAGWQETTDHPCDVGSAVADLEREFPGVDFSQVDPVFPDKTSERGQTYAYTQQALVARGQMVLAELRQRPEPVILVVSHSAFLSKAVSGAMFGNADYRVFSFEDEAAPCKLCPPAPATPGLEPLQHRLCEWEETRSRRGGMGWSYEEVREIGEGLPGSGVSD